MINLAYCREDTVDQLVESISHRLEWYFDPRRTEILEPLNRQDAVIKDSTEIEPFWQDLILPDPKQSDQFRAQSDQRNVPIVYRALSSLSPVQAADGRLWVYLCHAHCALYVKVRWMVRRPTNNEKAQRNAFNHFFTSTNRSFIRDNGISRLWWIGHIAKRIEPGNEERFLEVALNTQEIRQQLLERPSLAMNPKVLSQMYCVMREHFPRRGQDGDLFRRETFRLWMRLLNGRGGMVLLDAMSDESLRTLLRSEAERAIEEFA